MYGRNIDFIVFKNGGNDLYYEVYEKYLLKSILINIKVNVYVFLIVIIKKKKKKSNNVFKDKFFINIFFKDLDMI